MKLIDCHCETQLHAILNSIFEIYNAKLLYQIILQFFMRKITSYDPCIRDLIDFLDQPNE